MGKGKLVKGSRYVENDWWLNSNNWPRAPYDRDLEVKERRWLAHTHHDCSKATVCTLVAGQQSACCDRHGVPARRSTLTADHRIALVVMPTS